MSLARPQSYKPPTISTTDLTMRSEIVAYMIYLEGPEYPEYAKRKLPQALSAISSPRLEPPSCGKLKLVLTRSSKLACSRRSWGLSTPPWREVVHKLSPLSGSEASLEQVDYSKQSCAKRKGSKLLSPKLLVGSCASSVCKAVRSSSAKLSCRSCSLKVLVCLSCLLESCWLSSCSLGSCF